MVTNEHQKSTKFADPKAWKGWSKAFGNREFVRTFWKLIMPSILWGGITSVVPLFFNLFSSLFFSNGDGGHSNLYIAVNYTYDTLSTVNYLVVTLLFSVFPAIGNFIGYGQFRNYRETVRFALYVGLASCTILMIFEQIFARDFAINLVYLEVVSNEQLTMCTNLIRLMSFMSYAFLWMWLYIPSLSSIKNTTVVLWSSIISLIFFFIADPVYLYCLTKGVKDVFDNGPIQSNAAYGIGAIYITYFFIQPIVVYIYCKFINHFKYAGYKIKFWFLKTFKPQYNPTDYDYYLDKELELIKYAHFQESELLFFDDWRVSGRIMKQVCKLAWGNILDQLFFNSFSIVHLIFVTNFGGGLPTGPGFNVLDPSVSGHAGHAFYKTIYNIPSMLITFFYGIFNAFTVAPQYFVARELGKGNIKDAKRNAYICINWSYAMGAVFMVIIIIFAFFITRATLPANNPNDLYVLVKAKTAGGAPLATATYAQVWAYSRNMMLLFSIILFTSTISNMTLYVVIQGASKYIVLADTLGKVIFTVIAVVLHYSRFDNLYAYYVIPHLDRFFQWIIYMIILGTGQCFNSIHTVNKKGGKKLKEINPTIYEKPVVSLDILSRKD
ncbi:hypothetical protein UREOM_5420 [Ureaplasma sp. OM1]|uniref:Uncharacterized protein n=2 Tax=Ureaplasma ceti TaxID=3119530 RepID=A0ABP9U666_9BACT